VNSQLTEEEKKGVRAIVYLQSLAGITETEEQAIIGWRLMTPGEQEQTLYVFKIIRPKEEP